MIKETFRFMGIFILILITITAFLFLYKSAGLLTYFLFHPEDGFSHFLNLLRLYYNVYFQYFVALILFSLFLTGFSFFNSTRLKMKFSFWQGFAVLAIWGILTIAVLMIVNPKMATIDKEDYVFQNYKKSGEQGYDDFFNKIYEEQDYETKSKKFLKINGEIILFSTYKDKIFRNIIYLLPLYENNHKEGIIFAHQGRLDNSKDQIILENPFYLKNGEKEYLPGDSKIVNLAKLLDRVYGRKKLLNNPEDLEFLFNKDKNYFPIADYESYLRAELELIKNNRSEDENKEMNWLFIIGFICEILGILFIFGGFGILLHNKSIPLLNLATSIIVGVLILVGLSFFYPIPKELMDKLISILEVSPDLIQIYGVLYLLIAIIISILAYVKFRKIQFDFSKD